MTVPQSLQGGDVGLLHLCVGVKLIWKLLTGTVLAGFTCTSLCGRREGVEVLFGPKTGWKNEKLQL